jgi:hypothetical protein
MGKEDWQKYFSQAEVKPDMENNEVKPDSGRNLHRVNYTSERATGATQIRTVPKINQDNIISALK